MSYEVVEFGQEPASLPTDSEARKNIPLVSGCLDYFPAALAEIARLSKYGNDKHNPGEPLHWARGKSPDHADCIVRHLVDRGTMDGKFSHSVMVAWRALALLQEELEAAGAPLARGARLDTVTVGPIDDVFDSSENPTMGYAPCTNPECTYPMCIADRARGARSGKGSEEAPDPTG